MNKCYLKSGKKKNCSGCGACANVCPKKAIEMVADENGFIFPVVDKNKCINCNLCIKTCPFNYSGKEIMPSAFSYITRSEDDLVNSSSGGAFGDIVNAFYEDDNTYIYGCTLNNNKAIHIGTNRIEDTYRFKKSKYIQSNMKNVYTEIKEHLSKNAKVLFSGTPCEVAALKSFLKKDYDNLLCVDIICHGVPSQKTFDDYIKNEEKKYGKKIKNVIFRFKRKEHDGLYSSKNIKIEFEDGSDLVLTSDTSSYLKGFQKRLFYRESCYSCKYASVNRFSDITISDAWGITKIKECDFHKGVSYVILNTEKGAKLFDMMTGEKEILDLDFIIENNECYTSPSEMHYNRKKYFKMIGDNDFDIVVNELTKSNIKIRIIMKVKRIMNKVKNKYKRIITR